MNLSLWVYRSAIKEAVWLWWLLNSCAQPSGEEWPLVASGNPISDAELATHLDCPEQTARRWREPLERAGLIRCTLAQPWHRRIKIRDLSAPTEQAEAKKTGLVN